MSYLIMPRNPGNNPGSTKESGSLQKSNEFFLRACPTPPEKNSFINFGDILQTHRQMDRKDD